MKRIFGFLLIAAAATAPAAWAEKPAPVPEPDGLVRLDHVEQSTCLAVRVIVPEDQAVAGLRWYNGSSEPFFQSVLTVGSEDPFPPALSEAVSQADSIQGEQEDWTELEFSEPIAGSAGSLFLILQYPPDYEAPLEGTPLGVGYQQTENDEAYFVTDDGESWVRIASRCRLLMEPVFCVLDDGGPGKSQQDEVPGALPKQYGVSSYPNPFNPVAKIELALPKGGDCSLKLYDLRGRLVKDFEPGHLEAGYHTYQWNGKDDGGRQQSSGVYFAQVRVNEKTLNHRLILIK